MKASLYILLIGSLILSSCEDKIDLDVPVGPTRLVVDALLSNGSSDQTITLSTTAPYFSSSQTPRVTNARVYVTVGTSDTISFNHDAPVPGNYVALYDMVDTAKEYVLHIEWNGNKYRSFPEKMHRVPPIDTLIQSEEKFPQQGDFRQEGYAGLLTTVEPKGLGDYYRWIIKKNNKVSTDPFSLLFSDDRLVDGNKIKDWDIVYELQPDDTVEVWQMSISERAYHFWSLLFAQITKFGGPFDTPPAPIEGNVYNENDENEMVLGFFGVSKVEKAILIVKER